MGQLVSRVYHGWNNFLNIFQDFGDVRYYNRVALGNTGTSGREWDEGPASVCLGDRL